MNIETILRLLENSGFHGLSADSEFIYMEDPSCILRGFEDFIEYAWIAVVGLTGFLLFGWAISMIRGAPANSIFMNMRNLLLIFFVLSVAKPIINLVYGENLFARGCETISVPVTEMNKLLELRKAKLASNSQDDLYEDLYIYDSGVSYSGAPIHEIPFADAPIYGAGTPGEINATPETNTTKNNIVNVADLPTYATESGADVIYKMPDGTSLQKTGGTRAWRNSNPGNIRYTDFAKRVGAIGQAGGFAVFPDEATGMYAIEALLRTDSYNKLTVKGAISRYAPPSENNTKSYHRHIEQLTGIPVNTPMAELTQTELSRVANAIKQIEGWRPGTTQRI